MPREIFDQDRPRSAMARRLDEAFAGCEEWTVAPAAPRRSSLDVAPWLAAQLPAGGHQPRTTEPESRAA